LDEIPAEFCEKNFDENFGDAGFSNSNFGGDSDFFNSEKSFDGEISTTEIFDDFADAENSLEIGDEIEHAQFGRGKVLQIEGDILTVKFANETKRIAASIAPLRRF
jgi:hypothetical protein